MNNQKLNNYLDAYGKANSPEVGPALLNSIMDIPYENDQDEKLSWDPKNIFIFLMPRISALTAFCLMGIYMGSAGSSALAEDEAAEIDYKITFDPNSKIFISDNLNTLLDIEGLIFVEEKIK